MKSILGIDVAKAKLDLALRRPEGKTRIKLIDNTRQGFETLLAWLAGLAGPAGRGRTSCLHGSHRYLLGVGG